jgi:hypothetical protein
MNKISQASKVVNVVVITSAQVVAFTAKVISRTGE